MDKVIVNRQGLGFMSVLTLILITLKLMGYIQIGWFLCLLPTLFFPLLGLSILASGLMIFLIALLWEHCS